jgi:hypothetical protein
MVREMITLPARIGVCATRLGLRVTTEVVRTGLGVTARVVDGALGWTLRGAAADTHERPSTLRIDIDIESPPRPAEKASPPIETPSTVAGTASPPPSAPVNGRPAATAPAHPSSEPATQLETARPHPSPEPATQLETAPAHISAEPELVESFAEPGAEDGAGAAVHVEEPWKGYGRMTAAEVIGRLVEASSEELAAVTLYESVHRRRRTVLGEAERRLQRAAAAARSHA